MVELKPENAATFFDHFLTLVRFVALIIVLLLMYSTFQVPYFISDTHPHKLLPHQYLGYNKTSFNSSIILRSHSPPTLLSSSNKSKFARERLFNQNTYATFISSPSLLPALEVFIYTFVKSNSKYPVAVCVPIMNNGQDLVSDVSQVLRKYRGLEWTIYAWPLISPPRNTNTPQFITSQSSLETWLDWTHLQLWAMTQYEIILYVDLAVIFQKNADYIFTTSIHLYKSTKDSGEAYLLQPSIPVLSHLLQSREHIKCKSGLIELLKRIFSDNGCCLPRQFFADKTEFRPSKSKAKAKSGLNESLVSIIHFSGEKPWTSWSTFAFRSKFLSKKVRKALALAKQWDADTYYSLHNKWKNLYFKARKSEFRKLIMFQGYHHKSCWTELSHLSFYRAVRLAGRIRPSPNHAINSNFNPSISFSKSAMHNLINTGTAGDGDGGDNDSDVLIDTRKRTPVVADIDAPSLVHQLRSSDFQLAVGEFGAMLAVSALDSNQVSQFVGFSSWREAVKANWKEGASMDWTKIDFKENTIYFWYSIHENKNRSYYEVMDSEHSGMSSVMRDLVGFPLPDMSRQNYVYAHYFISSKEVFLEYVDDALKFTNRFLAKHPINSKCPFGLPEDTAYPDKRCVGYILERYINVWATYKKLQFVYAVDHPEWRLS